MNFDFKIAFISSDENGLASYFNDRPQNKLVLLWSNNNCVPCFTHRKLLYMLKREIKKKIACHPSGK